MVLLSFLTIGAINALVDIGMLNLLLWLRPATDPAVLFIYNTVAYISAVMNSYIWNSRITFRRMATFHVREKLHFAMQAGIALLVNNTAFLLGYAGLSSLAAMDLPNWLQYNFAKALAMGLSSACSFILMKYIVFQRQQ